MLEALAPSAIDVSLQIAEDLELEHQQLHDQWKQRLERADYETMPARRRYEAVDPDNRLVARTLERDWEASLTTKKALDDDYQRALARQPERLTEAEKEDVRRLAEDVPSILSAASTTARGRQAIARMMLDRVVIRLRIPTKPATCTDLNPATCSETKPARVPI